MIIDTYLEVKLYTTQIDRSSEFGITFLLLMLMISLILQLTLLEEEV
nr:MAG TPA: hypothetical protein [Bacteriophage sp.]